MKVLLVSMQYDYGDKARGLSSDYYYIECPLKQLGMNVISFDFMTVFQEQGQERMNQALLDLVRREKPDVTVVVPYANQFIPKVMDEINKHTVTLGYYFDDTWRIEYSGFWAKHFTYVTTSDVNGIKKWRDAGCNNFLYSPFGCNHRLFVKKDLPKIYDVSFIGGYHPYRAWCLRKLRKAGISVHAWGHGWPNGRIGFEDMVDVFNQSRINLNLSNSISWDARYLVTPFRPLKTSLQVWRGIVRDVSHSDMKVVEQVKGRHFEINSCGGFQLSYYVEGLECHYQIGKEIALYASIEDMVDKVCYYLKHEDERESIACHGYERTLKDHTMDQRLRKILAQAGSGAKA